MPRVRFRGRNHTVSKVGVEDMSEIPDLLWKKLQAISHGSFPYDLLPSMPAADSSDPSAVLLVQKPRDDARLGLSQMLVDCRPRQVEVLRQFREVDPSWDFEVSKPER